MPVLITREFIESGKPESGYTREQCKILGTPYPLKPGWEKYVIGGTLTDEMAEKFLELQDELIPQHICGKLIHTPFSKLPEDLKELMRD